MKIEVVITLAVLAWSQFTRAETNFPNVEPMEPRLSVAHPRWPEKFSDSVDIVPGDFHIAGGPQSARYSQPHQVFLTISKTEDKRSSFCGGSLISDSWILTAGHCVKNAFHTMATLGKHNISYYEPTQLTVKVQTIVVHPFYTKRLHHDIALLKLANRVRIESDKLSSVLRSVDSWVVSNVYCGFWYLSKISSSQMCVSGFRGKSTCKGDDGGPLYIVEDGTKTLIGIASWGFNKCEWSWPPVFTRVTSYLDWIHSVTGIPPRT